MSERSMEPRNGKWKRKEKVMKQVVEKMEEGERTRVRIKAQEPRRQREITLWKEVDCVLICFEKLSIRSDMGSISV
jgi:hypothetical protein